MPADPLRNRLADNFNVDLAFVAKVDFATNSSTTTFSPEKEVGQFRSFVPDKRSLESFLLGAGFNDTVAIKGDGNTDAAFSQPIDRDIGSSGLGQRLVSGDIVDLLLTSQSPEISSSPVHSHAFGLSRSFATGSFCDEFGNEFHAEFGPVQMDAEGEGVDDSEPIAPLIQFPNMGMKN